MKCSRNITVSFPTATIETIDSCPSTNRAIDRNAPHGHCLLAREQTAGRGQRQHTWEAAPGQNITMSMMLRHDNLPAGLQFTVSEAVSLGIKDMLASLGIDGVEIKWPNDIYVGEKKICGILIENALQGSNVSRSIAGIGINVNQTEFISDAPNPVSIKEITGNTYDIVELAQKTADCILRRLTMAHNHTDYLNSLRHRSGLWPWKMPDGSLLTAELNTVTPEGFLLLKGCDITITNPFYAV